MTKKPPKEEIPLSRKGENFREIYVTGAFASPSPFDFRLIFYTHEPEISKDATPMKFIPMHQVMQVEVVMSQIVARQLRDLLNRQLPEEKKGGKNV